MSRRPNIRPAERRGQYIRWLLGAGPSGGKTYTALQLAGVLSEGQTFLVIDTEPAGPDDSWSADLYTDLPEMADIGWDTWGWPKPYQPEDLGPAIMEQAADYPLIMIDSASPFWHASGGILAHRDEAARLRFGGNDWAAWSEVRPVQENLIWVLQNAPCHIVLCVRAKVEWAQTSSGPKAVGTMFKQDPELEHEVTIATYMDRENGHRMHVRKSRATAVARPGDDFQPEDQNGFFVDVLQWTKTATPVDAPATAEAIEAVRDAIRAVEPEEARDAVKGAFAEKFGKTDGLTAPKAVEAMEWLAGSGPAPVPVAEDPEPPAAKPAAKKKTRKAKPKAKTAGAKSEVLTPLQKAVMGSGPKFPAINAKLAELGWWPIDEIPEDKEGEALDVVNGLLALDYGPDENGSLPEENATEAAATK